MSENWLEKWNQRYSEKEFAFGVEPNIYFKSHVDKLPVGKILFPAEGEGRNAVYAAQSGWDVSAFDISFKGRKKAMELAKQRNVSLDYKVGELPELAFDNDTFDAIALIYAHFPTEIKSNYHQILSSLLKTGGTIIFEAFSKNHLEYRAKNPGVGGPSNFDSLFSKEEILKDFKGYEVMELGEEVIDLQEGKYHVGKGSVIRFVGRKSRAYSISKI
ncbi:class I SAM-dependent methyltransferase [Membranihabitans maritimus]|uniref:class I SAM-dependent methyltransferase n=1 Tax=Membranihabitans maritimus TaxID=2904244 RepID=UPI001F2DF6F6|nr:class I SAM-dependent methyltransferase [Membranihabitans maritimus]